MAHAFFGSCLWFQDADAPPLQRRRFGDLSFWRLYARPGVAEAEERLVCLLVYFAHADDCDAKQLVEFERVVGGAPTVDFDGCRKRIRRDLTIVRRFVCDDAMCLARMLTTTGRRWLAQIHDQLMEAPMLNDDRPGEKESVVCGCACVCGCVVV